MKRFRFALRPVAIVRAHREVRAREAFAAAVGRHQSAQEELRQVSAKMRALETALADRRAKSFSGAEAALLLSDYRGECTSESEAHRLVNVAREEMLKARLDYLEAHRQLEVVDKLEVKAREVHRRDGLREEQNDMDELAGQRRNQAQLAPL